MIKLAVAGAAGRMGRRIVALAAGDPLLQIVAAMEADGSPEQGRDVGELAGIGRSGVCITHKSDLPFDVLIDFTTASATIGWLTQCVDRKRPMVIGTTGHDEADFARIRDASREIAVLKSPNMSVGVNVMIRAVEQFARVLDTSYDVEIVEAHHRFKIDAPSGTALALKEAVDKGRGSNADTAIGRQGRIGERPCGQIGIHSLRIGDTVGEHEVSFGTIGESIRISHVAHSRDAFAVGVLRAAKWICDKPPGIYTMLDVLFGRTDG